MQDYVYKAFTVWLYFYNHHQKITKDVVLHFFSKMFLAALFAIKL